MLLSILLLMTATIIICPFGTFIKVWVFVLLKKWKAHILAMSGEDGRSESHFGAVSVKPQHSDFSCKTVFVLDTIIELLLKRSSQTMFRSSDPRSILVKWWLSDKKPPWSPVLNTFQIFSTNLSLFYGSHVDPKGTGQDNWGRCWSFVNFMTTAKGRENSLNSAKEC